MSAFGGGNSEFDNGAAAMRIFGRWPQSGMIENPNIDLGVVGTPKGAVDANVLFWGGFGIFSGRSIPRQPGVSSSSMPVKKAPGLARLGSARRGFGRRIVRSGR